MPTQHIATLLGATCCVCLVTVLRCVVTCWVLLAQVWKRSDLSQQQPTCRNRVAKRAQHVAPNNVAICCVGMLRSFVRGLTNMPCVACINGERVGWGQKRQENRPETTGYSEKETVSNKQHTLIALICKNSKTQEKSTPTQVRRADLLLPLALELRPRACSRLT